MYAVKQIEAADKQLRSTRKFQEEQAVEREAEREEAIKQIKQLQERLRELEREKDRDYREYCIDSAEVFMSTDTFKGFCLEIHCHKFWINF